MIRAIACLMIASCAASVTIEEPNTTTVCERAAECGAVSDAAPCVKCLEHVADPALLESYADDLPPLESIACDALNGVVRLTNLPQCVNERWYGP